MTYIDFSELLDRLSKAIDLTQDIIRDTTARKLLTLMSEKNVSISSLADLKSLIEYGYINKVLLTFMHYGPERLRRTSLYRRLVEQRRNFLRHLESVIKVLDKCKIDYVVFKTLRPVIDTPVDIDIVVESADSLYEATAYLKRVFNAKIWNIDYYSIGIEIEQFGEYVDIYLKPHAANFVYFDNNELLRKKVWLHVREHEVELYVPVPRPELELCSVLLHAFIKEGLITLNDVLSVLVYKMLSDTKLLVRYLSGFPMRVLHNEFARMLKLCNFPAEVRIYKQLMYMLILLGKDYSRESFPKFVISVVNRTVRVVRHRRKMTYVRGLER